MTHAWKWYAGVVAALVLAQRVAGGYGDTGFDVQSAISLVLNLMLIGATVTGVHFYKPADRVTWRFLLANQVLFLLGGIGIVVVIEVMGPGTYPSPADAIFFSTYVALIFAMFRIVRAHKGDHSERAAALDAIVMAAGATVVAWQFWIRGSISASMPLPALITSVAFPILDITMFALAVRALVGRGRPPVSLRLCSATLLLLFLGDALVGWQIAQGTFVPHNWIDVIYGACIATAGVMALHPSMPQLTEAPATIRAERFSRARLLSMIAASAVAPFVMALNAVEDLDVTELVVAVCALVMFGGVIGRAYLSSQSVAWTNAMLQVKQTELEVALDALRATEAERVQLLDSVMCAGEQERKWVAAELHDGPIQQLAALGFSIDRVRRRYASGDMSGGDEVLERARDELTGVVTGLRKLMSELRPPALDESGLEGALRDYVSVFRRETGVDCALDIALGTDRLPPEFETTIYRVAQEALQNIRRHAAARAVHIFLVQTAGAVKLRIADDGRGFDPTKPLGPDATAHFGLVGMRERVEQRGGRWSIRSRANQGTTIDAELPLAKFDLPTLSLAEVSR